MHVIMKSIQLNSCLVFGLFVITSLVLYVSADYQVKVQLFTFENPTHQWPRPLTLPPVFCCDGDPLRDPCTGDICDIYIVLCLNPFGLSPVSDDRINVDGDTNCDNDTVRVSEVFRTPNPTMNVDDITFDVGETALLGLPNPFIFNQTGEWPGGVQLVVQVFDDDSNYTDPNNDFDESLQSVIINIDQLGASPPSLIVGAEGVGIMNVSYEVTCTENYYGPNCTTFCEERDDEQGHYTCDSEGNIVCKDGYTDSNPCQNGGSCMDLVADYISNYPLGKDCEREEGEGTSPEGVDPGTVAGAGTVGMVVIILLILIILVLVIALVLKQHHRKVQITDPTTISPEPNPAYKYSTRQVQSNLNQHLGPPEELVSALQDTTEYYMNEGMGEREDPPEYDYPVVQPGYNS